MLAVDAADMPIRHNDRPSGTRRVPMKRLLTAGAVTLLMVLTACNRGGHHSGDTSTDIDKRRAYAQCMRDNGVPNFPDPDADGKFPREAEQKAHNDPKFQAASEKCRKNLPQHG